MKRYIYKYKHQIKWFVIWTVITFTIEFVECITICGLDDFIELFPVNAVFALLIGFIAVLYGDDILW